MNRGKRLEIVLALCACLFLLIGCSPPAANNQTKAEPDSTDVARAFQTQQAISLPGPEPTAPPPVEQPTPSALDLLRIAYKQTPYQGNVFYVLQSGDDLYIRFEPQQSYEPGVGAWNTRISVGSILGVLSESPIIYKRAILMANGYPPPSGETIHFSADAPVWLVYTREVVKSHKWLSIVKDVDIYAFAESQHLDPGFIITPFPSLTPDPHGPVPPGMATRPPVVSTTP